MTHRGPFQPRTFCDSVKSAPLFLSAVSLGFGYQHAPMSSVFAKQNQAPSLPLEVTAE